MPKIKVCGGCHMNYIDYFSSHSYTDFPNMPYARCDVCGEETAIMAIARIGRGDLKRARAEEKNA
jgi:hypothetical protein